MNFGPNVHAGNFTINKFNETSKVIDFFVMNVNAVS